VVREAVSGQARGAAAPGRIEVAKHEGAAPLLFCRPGFADVWRSQGTADSIDALRHAQAAAWRATSCEPGRTTYPMSNAINGVSGNGGTLPN